MILESCFWSVRSDRVHEAPKLISLCDPGRKIKGRNENQPLGERNAIVGWKRKEYCRLKESDPLMICAASVEWLSMVTCLLIPLLFFIETDLMHILLCNCSFISLFLSFLPCFLFGLIVFVSITWWQLWPILSCRYIEMSTRCWNYSTCAVLQLGEKALQVCLDSKVWICFED